MKETLLDVLACPACLGNELDLAVHARDAREIREGELRCKACQAVIPIHNGIVHALSDPPQKIASEIQGWIKLLDVPSNQHEFKDDWILALPFIRPDQTPNQDSVRLWRQMGKHFFKNLDRIDVRGKRVLEIGAGRCWGVAELARRGAEAVGLDVVSHKYIGLETADVWLAAHQDMYFERVLGDMHKLPFRPGSFDLVVTTASLHHTDTLALALREITRVLTASGNAFFMNEPVVPDDRSGADMSDSPEVRAGITESRFTYGEWIAAFETAGFATQKVRVTPDLQILLQKGPRAGGSRSISPGVRGAIRLATRTYPFKPLAERITPLESRRAPLPAGLQLAQKPPDKLTRKDIPMTETDDLKATLPDGIIEIRDPEIDAEAIMRQIRANIRQRREAARTQGIDFDAFLDGIYHQDQGHFEPAVYYNIRRMNTMYDRITVKQYVSPRSVPLVGELMQRVRVAMHDLVIYYVNMLGSKQVLFNEALVYMLNDLLAGLEKDAGEMAAMRKELDELRARLAKLEGQG